MNIVKICKTINKQLDLLVAALQNGAVQNQTVSNWSVQQHLEHTLKATFFNLKRIVENSTDFISAKKRLLPVLVMIMLTGKIPRGKGSAPEKTLPLGASKEEILVMIKQSKDLIAEVEKNHPKLNLNKCRFEHYRFGGLSEAQWLRFIAIHHDHHLKIIGEIVSTA